ncbi:MAG TPA: cellulase N-terminal Ig-like domain-containing protein, partial [Gemmatimonadaceae bacterium]|nr:cellulase N-terminal Ig-like domain-containing protein [Gemmatimonadaceae bacterium]
METMRATRSTPSAPRTRFAGRGAALAAAVALGAGLVAAPLLGRSTDDDGAAAIRLNQIGFYPDGPKVAIVADSGASSFAVLGADRGDTVYRGTLSAPLRWAPSGEIVRRADFGALRRVGRYVIAVPGVGRSRPFVVDTAAMRDVARGAVKAYYYMRASVPLTPEYAGRWARAAGHPDTAVLVHPSAADARRPA